MEINQQTTVKGEIPSNELQQPLTGAINRLLAAIKPYRELIIVITGVIGIGIMVLDYFATRAEVKILKCESRAQISELENRMEMEAIRKSLLNRELVPGTQSSESKIFRQEDSARIGKEIINSIDVDSMKKRFAKAEDALAFAREKLKSRRCEELVRQKKDE